MLAYDYCNNNKSKKLANTENRKQKKLRFIVTMTTAKNCWTTKPWTNTETKKQIIKR